MKKALAIVLLAGAAGCGSKEDTAAAVGPIAVTTQPVRVTTTLRDAVTGTGIVAPTAAADFIVTAPEAAEIVELTRNEGDVVKAGDVLVRLEIPAVSSEITTRQLEFGDASSRVDKARAEAERLGKLFEQGLTARNTWEASRAALATAELTLSQAKGRFDVAKALEATTIIRARFSGVIAKRWHVQGDLVSAGDQDPILRVVDPTRLQIIAQVPIGGSTRILPGQIASVLTPLDPVAQPAVVSMRLTPASPTATTVEVRLNFVGPTTLAIDTAVQVDVILEERKDAIVVPNDALQRAEGLVFVWVPNENNQATRRQVQTGLTAGGVTQILSGLTAGELIIVTGLSELTEGASITIK